MVFSLKYLNKGRVVALSLVAVVLFIFICLFCFSEKLLEIGLASAGHPESKVENVEWSPNGTVLTNIEIPSIGLHINKLTLYALAGDVTRGRLGKAVIDGLTYRRPDKQPAEDTSTERLDLRGVDLHIRELVLTNGKIYVSPTLPVIAVNGEIYDRDTHYQAALRLATEQDNHEQAVLQGIDISGAAELVKETGAAKAQFDIHGGQIVHALAQIRRLSGWINIETSPDTPLPVVNAQIAAGAAEIADIPLRDISFTASGHVSQLQALLSANLAQSDKGRIEAEGVFSRLDDQENANIRIDVDLPDLKKLGVKSLDGHLAVKGSLNATKPTAASYADIAAYVRTDGHFSLVTQKLSLGDTLRQASATAEITARYDAAGKQITLDAADKSIKADFILGGEKWAVDMPSFTASYAPETSDLAVDVKKASAQMPQAMFKDVGADIEAIVQPYPVVTGKISIGEMSSAAKPALFTPLKLDANFRSLSSRQYATGFDALVSGQSGALMLKAQGFHDASQNTGQVRAKLEPIDLKSGITTLDEFIPVSSRYIEDVSGIIAAFGGADWRHDGEKWIFSSKGQLKLENVAGAYAGDFPFTGLNSVLAFDSLTPPAFSQQKIAIGAFTAGLPLQNGLVTLSLKNGNTLSLHDGRMDMAGGKITVAPFSIDLEKRTGRIVLGAGGLDLEKLFAVAPMEGLSASGEVDGTLPLLLSQGSITLDQGVLQSTGPGVLKYAPQQLPSFLQDDTNTHMVTLRTALADFHFSNLRMGLSGNLLGNQAITLTIEGNNPSFYGGHPVKLNLNVEGPLQNILRYAPGTSTIPDTIEKQLEQFEENNALSTQ